MFAMIAFRGLNMRADLIPWMAFALASVVINFVVLFIAIAYHGV